MTATLITIVKGQLNGLDWHFKNNKDRLQVTFNALKQKC